MAETTVTPAMIKELRERTGVGMTKCKEALDEAKGNMEEAIAILRKAGMASAVKKQGRETKEGAILAKATPTHLVLVEVNAETDFVVQNDRFKQFCQQVLETALKQSPSSLEMFLQQPTAHDPSITVDQLRSLAIQTIGENIQIRRVEVKQLSSNASVGIYSHMGGKLLTYAILNSAGEEDVAKAVAMHVAAAAPEFLSPSDIPASVIENEREIAKGQMQGKPAHIMDKILEGKINAYYDQVCLKRQKYIRDDTLSVEQFVAREGKIRNKDLALIGFGRWAVAQ